MSRNVIRKLRTAVLGLILSGGTVLTAPVGGCDPGDVTGGKLTAGNAAHLLIEEPVLPGAIGVPSQPRPGAIGVPSPIRP